MKGDFSRLNFKSRVEKHYAAVLEQQGRLTIDPDWNEAVVIDQHLTETTNRDVIGACGAPKHAPGFKIGLDKDATGAVKDLTISKGRIYVDGILCELEEDTKYTKQKAYPGAKLEPVDAPRADLVYLDVWRRHVTAVEDPDLREVALGGPDTTTRLQTVCQVKILKDVGDVTCGSKISKWDTLVGASQANLTTDLIPAQADEPCFVAPGGGYKGLENHLYRVEIHDGADPADPTEPATFKWSRDNGSVVVGVQEFKANDKVQVARLGWDEVLSLRQEDWVEVLGDASELAGKPGTLAKITNIDPETRILTLDRDVSGHKMEAYPRIRRWDQASKGINVTSGKIELEDGIRVELGGSGFKTGDFWVFAARVGNGSGPGTIDLLNDQPPMGIEHHYCKVALVTWSQSGQGFKAEVETCLVEFPPLTELPSAGAGCCNVTVGDGVHSVGDYTDLRDALQAVSAGGTVCLLPGEYHLAETVALEVDNLVLSGCGGRARVVAPQDLPAFTIHERKGVRLEGLRVESSADGAVQVEGSQRIEIVACEIDNRKVLPGTGGLEMTPGPAVTVSASQDVMIIDSLLVGMHALSIQGVNLEVRRNRLSKGGIWVREGSLGVQIERNRIADGPGAGIALGGLMAGEQPPSDLAGVCGVRIEDNLILSMGGSGVSTVAQPDIAVATGDVDDVTIRGNRIIGCALYEPDPFHEEEAVGGIVLRNTSRVFIHDNHIVDNGAQRAGPSCGVFVHTCQGLEITDNQVLRNGSIDPGETSKAFQAGIVAIDISEDVVSITFNMSNPDNPDAAAPWTAAPTGRAAARVHDNVVVCPNGHALILVATGSMSVAANTLSSLDVRSQPGLPEANDGRCVYLQNYGVTASSPEADVGTAPAAYGILSDGWILFQGNQVTLQAPAAAGAFLSAVAMLSDDDLSISQNQIMALAPAGLWFGTYVSSATGTARVTGNRFTELPGKAGASYLGDVPWHVVTANQATHCLLPKGMKVIEEHNHVMYPSAACLKYASYHAVMSMSYVAAPQ